MLPTVCSLTITSSYIGFIGYLASPIFGRIRNMLRSFPTLLLILIIDNVIEGMEVIPERANATFVNPKYTSNVTINIRRYSRRSRYYINLMGNTKQVWNNNITVDIKVNQYLHNEYRPSFITHHYKFCDLINKDEFIGGAIRNAGVVCPLPAGYHGVMNITAPTEHFP
ncbi:hypothetical protein HF086_012229, partial [Spodoptera exigua]